MKPDRLQFAALLVAATAAALSCADHGITGPTAPSIGAPVFASTTSNKGGGGGGGGGGWGGGGGQRRRRLLLDCPCRNDQTDRRAGGRHYRTRPGPVDHLAR